MSVSVPPEAKKHLGEANLLYMAGNYQGATTLLLEVVRICPRLPHPYDTLGVIYEIEGKKKKALQLFLMAATLSKRDEGHWRRLASLATEVGESEQALFCLGKLLALAPDDEDALWEQAQLHVQLGHHRKASSVLASLLHSRPGNVEVAHHLARCYVELGMRDRAIDMLGLALASVRGDSPAEAAVGGGEGGAPPHRPGQAPSRSVAPSPATSLPPVAGGSAHQPDSPPGAPVPALSVETLECALHLTNMLVELLIEKGAYKEALARLLQLRALGWPDLPLEICVKQGVCHAYLGQLADADRLWQPLLDSLPPAAAETGDAGSSADHAAAGLSAQAKPDPATCAALIPYATAGGAGGGSALRLHETDYLLYEIAKVFLALALPHRALRIYDALLGSERYAPIVHLRRGECLDALRRAAEAADAYSEALAVNASSLEALLAACNLHLRQGQPAHVLALQLSHGCINTAAAGPVVAAGVQVSGAGGVGTGTRARWEGSLSGESTDPRLVALRGCAWSDLGRHAEAVAVLLPMQRACLVLMRPKPHRGKRDQADALGAGLEPPRKQLRMSASGEIVVDTGDGEGDGDGFRPATGFACGGHDGGSSEAEETDAWGGAQGDFTATEEELAAVQAAAGDGAAAARRLSQRARSIVHPLGSDELWFTLTERLTHSLWVTRGPTEAYEQVPHPLRRDMRTARARSSSQSARAVGRPGRQNKLSAPPSLSSKVPLPSPAMPLPPPRPHLSNVVAAASSSAASAGYGDVHASRQGAAAAGSARPQQAHLAAHAVGQAGHHARRSSEGIRLLAQPVPRRGRRRFPLDALQLHLFAHAHQPARRPMDAPLTHPPPGRGAHHSGGRTPLPHGPILPNRHGRVHHTLHRQSAGAPPVQALRRPPRLCFCSSAFLFSGRGVTHAPVHRAPPIAPWPLSSDPPVAHGPLYS